MSREITPVVASANTHPTAVKVDYTITFTTAFHIGTGYGTAGVLDATVVRRSDGNLYVPGASVKGRTRWRLTSLLGKSLNHEQMPCNPGRGDLICPLCNLFGSTWAEGTLYFGDAFLDAEQDVVRMIGDEVFGEEEASDQERVQNDLAALRRRSQVEERNGVVISRRRRVAKEELLFVAEVGRAGLRFEGSIEGTLLDQGRRLTSGQAQDVPEDLGWLVLALCAVEFLGARKSRGLGRCQISIDRILIGELGQDFVDVGSAHALLMALRTQVETA